MLPAIAAHLTAPARAVGSPAGASPDGSVLHIQLNGFPRTVAGGEPETTLASWLRDAERCVGLKLGCEVGACGSCTVVISEPDGSQRRPVVACLTPLASVDGLCVTTVESAALTDAGRAVQECMATGHATQCGFCTPGFVMALYARLDSPGQAPAMPVELERAVAGNICRCTGHRPIAQAATAAAAAIAATTGTTPAPPTPLPPLPAAGNDSAPRVLSLVGSRSGWIAPTDLAHLCSLKAEHGESAQLVGGATALAFSALRSRTPGRLFLATAKVPELANVRLTERGLECGAGANLLAIQAATSAAIASLTETGRVAETRSLEAFAACLEGYAWGSRQLLGTGTLGGALGCAPSYSSFLPLLCALGGAKKKLSRFPLSMPFLVFWIVQCCQDRLGTDMIYQGY
jgi:xanthine dehydrogenase small subunit